MALFSFKKKKDEQPQPFEFSQQSQSPAPTEEATRLRQQGYNNNQIAQYLQTKGYTQQQVSDAITQASLGGYQQPGNPGMQEFSQQNPYQSYQQFQQPIPQQQQQSPQQEGYSNSDERIEEIAEAIIDEKWQELVKDVKKVIEWKDTVESRLDHLEQMIKDVKSSMDNMQKGIFGKIQDYDRSINDVGTEIKAMEKVFQKVLPSLTESINRLDRISQKPAVKK
jgi:DNA-binding transcriptional MerR regulator